MVTLLVPYHLDEPLAGFDAGVPVDRVVVAELPAGGRWQRMAVLYEQVASAVAQGPQPAVVVSGDCTTSLGVLAGLQRAGRDPGVVWLDGHADFHTETTTTSGYLGGMPLALAAGVGRLTLPDLLGLRPVPQERVALVDARDTDPGEHDLLATSRVRQLGLDEVSVAALPAGELYLHVDLDVIDPHHVPELRYPAPGGPDVARVLRAVELVVGSGRVAAVGLAGTWRVTRRSAQRHRDLLRQLHAAAPTA